MPKNAKNTNKGKVFDKLGKILNISRISSPISPKLSKKVLEKSKFYKNKEKQDNKQEKMKD